MLNHRSTSKWKTPAIFLFWGLVWFIPLASWGLAKVLPPYVPQFGQFLYTVTGFFEAHPGLHKIYYAQVRADSMSPWTTLNESNYFPHHPYGHRTRFQRLMHRFRGHRGESARRELARWLVQHPNTPHNITELRFVVAGIDPQNATPLSHWQQPSWEAIPHQHTELLQTYSRHDLAPNPF
ncbi:MAG: hypothetical protein AAF558_07695 [Verrucomicrobiota bacterium]